MLLVVCYCLYHALNNPFVNITGDLLRLNKENDYLGIYNAEYLTTTSNTFDKIGNALVKLYSSRRDESAIEPSIFF